MRIGNTYIQYSKIITSLAALAYAAQVSITIVLACNVPEASDALIEILKTTTGLFGLIFGCYTGNSVVEKVNTDVVDVIFKTNVLVYLVLCSLLCVLDGGVF